MAKTWVAAEVRELFLQFWPVGRLYDWYTSSSNISKLVDAIVATVKQHGFDLVETLRDEVNPSTATQKIPDWEDVLGLTTTIVAKLGTTVTRRAAVVSKLREHGSDTPALIRSVIEPLLGYSAANSGTLQIIETDRSALKTLHTYAGGAFSVGSSSSGMGTAAVADGGHVSRAGAQLVVTLTCTNPEQLTIALSGPGGAYATFAALPAVAASSTAYYLNALPPDDDTAVGGPWTLSVATGAATCTVVSWSLFVEGAGLGGGYNGLGSEVYEYGVYADPAKVVSANYEGARAALARISHAYKRGLLLLSLSPEPDDSTSLPDACTPV